MEVVYQLKRKSEKKSLRSGKVGEIENLGLVTTLLKEVFDRLN